MSKNSQSVEGPDTLVHQCRLPLSTAASDMVAALRHTQRLADMAGAYESRVAALA
jgi:hypothetical protein